MSTITNDNGNRMFIIFVLLTILMIAVFYLLSVLFSNPYT